MHHSFHPAHEHLGSAPFRRIQLSLDIVLVPSKQGGVDVCSHLNTRSGPDPHGEPLTGLTAPALPPAPFLKW